MQRDIEIVEFLKNQKALIDQQLAVMSNSDPWTSDMVFLMQIPGFGIVFSMIVLSAIGVISPFESPKKLVGYAGLGAGVHDSGQKPWINPLVILQAGRHELHWDMGEAFCGAF